MAWKRVPYGDYDRASSRVYRRIRVQPGSELRQVLPCPVLQRIKDGKRYIGLVLRGYYGRSLAQDEEEESRGLLPGLYEAGAQLHTFLVNVKLGETPIFPSVAIPNLKHS